MYASTIYQQAHNSKYACMHVFHKRSEAIFFSFLFGIVNPSFTFLMIMSECCYCYTRKEETFPSFTVKFM